MSDLNINDDLVTFSAPINIALIKYWGKRCEKLNLPLNSSLSLTLHQDHLQAKTTVATSKEFTRDRVWLNGVEQDIQKNSRLETCLHEIRRLARAQTIKRNGSVDEITRCSQKIHVCSCNNFPTAAGLASSAAGYAALVASLGRLFGVQGDLSTVARRGSGSACRSMYGGFVEWVKGEDDSDGTDSGAIQLLDESHWKELRVFILVASSHQKAVGSTVGMQQSANSSTLLAHRVKEVVPFRLSAIKEAVSNKDFSALAEIIMKESNQLHALCRDTYPPLHYMNHLSEQIVNFVHAYNEKRDGVRLAYTFDAGPNAFLFTLESFASEVASLIQEKFGHAGRWSDFFRGDPIEKSSGEHTMFKDKTFPDSIEYVIYTRAGPGPQQLSNHHLLAKDTGLPLV